MASERKQPNFCVLTEWLSEAKCLRRKGERRGGVFFYEDFSCCPSRTKPPSAAEMEGKRLQAELRQTLSRKQAGDTS